nr:hypothetical protein [Tanacetum cinerariifolium]
VEELHKKALEEDPSAFAYDEIYDEMLEKKPFVGGMRQLQQQVEELHKKALEEDPSAFAYDEIYDEMLEKK